MSESLDYLNLDHKCIALGLINTRHSKFIPHGYKFGEATSSLHFLIKIITSVAVSRFSQITYSLFPTAE
jgi:hypothetical protein